MLERAMGQSNVIGFPLAVADAPADKNVNSIVEVLQELLSLAR